MPLSNAAVQAAVSARLLSSDGGVWYLTVTTTGVASLRDVRPDGEVIFVGQNVYWLLVYSPDQTPWYVAPTPMGDIRTTDLRPPRGFPGMVNLVPVRSPDGVLWTTIVSNTGVFGVTEGIPEEHPLMDDAPLFYCWRCSLAYRPDTRIWPLSTTHCPKDNSPLISWSDFMSGREGDFDPPGEYMEEVYR